MIPPGRAFSWLNQFNVSHLTPATRLEVESWTDQSVSDYTFAGIKQRVLEAITDLDPLERPEALLAAALAELQRSLLDASRASVRAALALYPENAANRHRRAVSLWMLGSLEYQALENNTAYSCWQAARLIFQELAAEQVRRRNPQQARWYYDRLRDMNVEMALEAEEAFSWLNLFPPDLALAGRLRSAGAAVPQKGDVDAHLRGLITRPVPDLPIFVVIDRVIDNVQRHRYASARRFMDQLRFLADRSSETGERPEIWLECGLAAHQMDLYEEAVELLRQAAAMFPQRSHQQAVTFWMIGAVLWRVTDRRRELIPYWNQAIAIFGELEEKADHQDRQGRWEWYHRQLEILPVALDRRTSRL